MYELKIVKHDGSQSETFLEENQSRIDYYQLQTGDLAILSFGLLDSFGEFIRTEFLDMWRVEEEVAL
jgi:hypothetical protein